MISPELVSPPSDAKFFYVSQMTLVWRSFPNATKYEIAVSLTSDFSELEFSREVTDTSTSTGNLPHGWHYWRVRGQNALGLWGDWSDSWRFNIQSEVDEATLAKWESEVDERDELLARKRWLLLHHPDFINELREVERAAGKLLPWGRILPPEMILHWDNLKELDRHGTTRRGFMVKYDLIPEPPGAGALNWELAKLRKLAKDGKWGKWDKKTFDRQAWWFELNQEGKSSREIAELTLKNKAYWIFIELQALSYWRTYELQKFDKLCSRKIAGVPTVEQAQDKLRLLYFLGRFRLGVAKKSGEEPAKEYPPFDGDSKELQTGRKYLVHVDYEWPDQLFEKEPEFTCSEELQDLRDDYLWYREQYTDKDSYKPIRTMIRKAIMDMKMKINKLL